MIPRSEPATHATRQANTIQPDEAPMNLNVSLPLGRFILDVEISSRARTLGIFGHSGAGKTSLLEIIAGWRAPRHGFIRAGGFTLFDSRSRISVPLEKRGIGYVPQDALLFPHWTVQQNLEAGHARDKEGGNMDHTTLMQRTVDTLEIEHLLQRSSKLLSGGEKQRAALARAVLSRPRLLLLDEPLGSLDLPLRRRILPYLIRVRDEFKIPTLFVSHDATEVQALCDEVIVLEAGKKMAQGDPREVLRDSRWSMDGFDNVLSGTISAMEGGAATVQLDGGGEVQVPSRMLKPGDKSVFSVGSDEILIALDAPTRISARNVLAASIGGIVAGADENVRIDTRLSSGTGTGVIVSATLTRSSAADLGLTVGGAVFLVFKASSCQVLSAGDGTR